MSQSVADTQVSPVWRGPRPGALLAGQRRGVLDASAAPPSTRRPRQPQASVSGMSDMGTRLYQVPDGDGEADDGRVLGVAALAASGLAVEEQAPVGAREDAALPELPLPLAAQARHERGVSAEGPGLGPRLGVERQDGAVQEPDEELRAPAVVERRGGIAGGQGPGRRGASRGAQGRRPALLHVNHDVVVWVDGGLGGPGWRLGRAVHDIDVAGSSGALATGPFLRF